MKYVQIVLSLIIIVPALIISMVVSILPSAILRLCKKNTLSDKWMRISAIGISKVIMFSLGTKITVKGRELIPTDGTPVCFVANHQSILDIPAVVGYLHLWAGFVTKKELQRIPIVNSWIRAIHCVYIDRKSPRSSIEAILKGVNNIRSGIPMFIFPEGTRSKTGKVGEFKTGSLKLATRAKATIVPITIEGTRSTLEGRKGIHIQKISLTVSPPIETSSLNEHQLKTLSDEIHSMISAPLQLSSNV